MGLKNILVTGSAGYIGEILTKELIRKGYFVTGVDSLFFKNFNLNPTKDFPFRKLDIRNISSDDLYGFDVIIHLAALSNDPLGNIDPNLTNEINFKQTVRLAKEGKKAGVKKFIFSSSCSVYGVAKNDTVNETSKTNPLTEYAKSKIKSEKFLERLSDKNFNVILMRNSTVYGFSPSFRDDLVLNNLTCSAFTTGKIIIKSDGTPWRPLIDVRDLSNIFIELINSNNNKIIGRSLNIGFNENNFQIKDLAKIINKKIKSSKIFITNEHGADSRSYKVNFDNFEKFFPNESQRWDLEKSVDDLVKNLSKYRYSKYDYLSGKYTRQLQIKKLLKKNKLTDKLYWKN